MSCDLKKLRLSIFPCYAAPSSLIFYLRKLQIRENQVFSRNCIDVTQRWDFHYFQVLEDSTLHCNDKAQRWQVLVRLTNTLDQYINDDSPASESGTTQQKSTQKKSQITTSSHSVFRASHLAWQDPEEVSVTPEEHSFLKERGLLKKIAHLFYSWKTSLGFYLTTRGKQCPSSLQRWMRWGTSGSTKSLTANIGFHRTVNVCSLSDNLEKVVDEKYFLSKEMVAKLVDFGKLDQLEKMTKHTVYILLMVFHQHQLLKVEDLVQRLGCIRNQK